MQRPAAFCQAESEDSGRASITVREHVIPRSGTRGRRSSYRGISGYGDEAAADSSKRGDAGYAGIPQ